MASERGLAELPIGIFDSGMGGLTVLHSVRARLPAEHYLYLGDTARLPYGTKSPESVTRYAVQAAAHLVERGVKLLVVACNTASAVAIPALTKEFAPLPVIGVVEAGADMAARSSISGHIGVLATECTVRGGAYERAIKARRPDACVFSQACSLFVALAEEGWTRGPLVDAVVREYLQPLLEEKKHDGLDCLVLGCTHFPLLKDAMARVAGADMRLVDSGETIASVIAAMLLQQGLARVSDKKGDTKFLATDDVQRFARIGGRFLGSTLAATDVERVDL